MLSKYTRQLTVIKRDGSEQKFDYGKVHERLAALAARGGGLGINHAFVAQYAIDNMIDRMRTRDIDKMLSDEAMRLSKHHPDFEKLAARIAISNHKKETPSTFSDVVRECYNNVNPTSGVAAPLVEEDFYKYVMENADVLDKMINPDRDYRLSVFGFSTILSKYLIKRSATKEQQLKGDKYLVIESPQDMFMRVAVALHMGNLDKIARSYELLSLGYISPASPTLFNSGTPRPQLLSCFLTVGDDSTEGICALQSQLAKISKHSGGVGVNLNLRSSGEPVVGVNGIASGPIPMLKIYESTALAFDQGGKRKGAFATYMSPLHPDFVQWLKCKRPTGKMQHLYYGCWIPDVFMMAVRDDLDWYFFDPHRSPEMYDLWGDDLNSAYMNGIEMKSYKSTMRARDVWKEILLTQKQSGMPYMLFSDTCNKTSNHKNLGTLQLSNLCTEILEYTTPDETACCVLTTICLPRYVVDGKDSDSGGKIFDFDQLIDHCQVVVENMNRMIDINWYPTPETKKSNMRHRPLSVGIQGLADVFMMMDMEFTSPEARALNIKIAEAVYYGCLRASCDLAKRDGPYTTFAGSDFSKGILAFDYTDRWNAATSDLDWSGLIQDIKTHGTRNSLLTGYPPTASSANIQGNNECFEPYTYIGYMRKTLCGEFYIGCSHFITDCIEAKCYSPDLIKQLANDRGSVQNLNIPNRLKRKYKTAWELSNKALIDMARDRQCFVDQSQSLNHYVNDPTDDIITKIHMHAWKIGMKTGMYYLHAQKSSNAVGFGKAVNDVKAGMSKTSAKPTVAEIGAFERRTPDDEVTYTAAPVCSLATGDCCSG